MNAHTEAPVNWFADRTYACSPQQRRRSNAIVAGSERSAPAAKQSHSEDADAKDSDVKNVGRPRQVNSAWLAVHRVASTIEVASNREVYVPGLGGGTSVVGDVVVTTGGAETLGAAAS